MKLYELQILIGESSTCDSRIAISCARVSTCARLVCPSLASRGKHRILSSESVESTISHVNAYYSNASTIVHYQIQQELLHKKVAILSESTPE